MNRREHYLTGTIILERSEADCFLNVQKNRKWIVGNLLGKSRVCDVFEFVDKKTRRIYAVKVSKKGKLDASDAKKYLCNLADLEAISHPILPRVQHSFENSENLYLFFPHYQRGSLKDLLLRRKTLHEVEVAIIAKTLLDYLLHVRKAGIMHRGISLANLVLDGEMNLHLTTFRHITRCNRQEWRHGQVHGGSLDFQPPEML